MTGWTPLPGWEGIYEAHPDGMIRSLDRLVRHRNGTSFRKGRELSQVDSSSESVFSPLTPREVEILDCVARGNSNKEIARLLSISDQTVKNHITSILRKLAVNDRTQAVIYALRHGWITIADMPPLGADA